MARRREFETVEIRRVEDVSPGDILFTKKDHPVVLLVARIYKKKESHRIITHFVFVSSGTSKIYDLQESMVAILSMKKVVWRDNETA